MAFEKPIDRYGAQGENRQCGSSKVESGLGVKIMKLDINKISRTAGDFKRRNVFKVGSVYLITIATLSALAADLLPTFGVPDWVVRFTVVILFLGFPVALILAWLFELNTEGVKIDRGNSEDQEAITLFSGNQTHLSVSVENNGRLETTGFNNSFTMGRSPGTDLQINNLSVSRRHARVFLENGVWMLQDLGSRNGTKLNGELINKAALPAYSEIYLSHDSPKIVIRIHDFEMDKTQLLKDTS